MALKLWLSQLNLNILSKSCSKIRIYIGNESGDLDSITSALCAAYAADESRFDDVTRHVPFLNFPRDQFPIKTESVFALRSFEICDSLLFFLPNEIGILQNLFSQKRLEIVLVDHNSPVDSLAPMASSIIMVIDHHKLVTPSILPQKVEMKMNLIGSCSSLVSKWIREEIKLEKVPKEIKHLIAATILVDTANFSPNQVVDQIDREEYTHVTSNVSGWDREKVYQEIIEARFDISELSTRQLLLKDAKYFKCPNEKAIFASTLHCDLEDFFNRENVFGDLEKFYSEDITGAELLLFMGTVSSGVNRGFGWYAPKLGEKFSKDFRIWQDSVESFELGEYLNLPEMGIYAGARTITGTDGKVLSRKKAIPILLSWFQKL